MKNLKTFVFLLAGVMILSMGCKKDPVKTPAETELELLAATWRLTGTGASVTLEGEDVSERFLNFSLTLRGANATGSNTYTSSSGAPAWAASGNYTLTLNSEGVPQGSFTRQDGVVVTYALSENNSRIRLSFNLQEEVSGAELNRTEVVTGNYVFTLNK
jgi:hypothetical protein